MIRFLCPWMVLLLLVPMILWLRSRRHARQNRDQRERQTTLLHPALDNLAEAFSSRAPAPPLSSRLNTLLLALLWIGLTLTVMRPQWLEPHTEQRQDNELIVLRTVTQQLRAGTTVLEAEIELLTHRCAGLDDEVGKMRREMASLKGEVSFWGKVLVLWVVDALIWGIQLLRGG